MRYQDCITLTRILQGKIFQGFDFLYGKFLHFVKAANIQPNKALSFPRFKSGIRIFLQIKPPAKKSVEIPPVLVIFLCFVTFFENLRLPCLFRVLSFLCKTSLYARNQILFFICNLICDFHVLYRYPAFFLPLPAAPSIPHDDREKAHNGPPLPIFPRRKG